MEQVLIIYNYLRKIGAAIKEESEREREEREKRREIDR